MRSHSARLPSAIATSPLLRVKWTAVKSTKGHSNSGYSSWRNRQRLDSGDRDRTVLLAIQIDSEADDTLKRTREWFVALFAAS